MPDYYDPSPNMPPQLSRAQLAEMDPDDIVQADQLGQFEVIRTGRDPLPFEAAGQRRATTEEDALARDTERQKQRLDAATNRAEQIRRYQQETNQ